MRTSLPHELDIEVERMTPSLFPILSYNLEGGEPATLYDIASYQLKPLISRVPGVGRVDVQGERRSRSRGHRRSGASRRPASDLRRSRHAIRQATGVNAVGSSRRTTSST